MNKSYIINLQENYTFLLKIIYLLKNNKTYNDIINIDIIGINNKLSPNKDDDDDKKPKSISSNIKTDIEEEEEIDNDKKPKSISSNIKTDIEIEEEEI